MSLRLAALLCTFGILACACLAESTDCAAPVLIVPDGRTTQGSIPAATTYWYGVYALAYHSYSVEFVPAADNFLNNFRPQFNGVTVYAPSDTPTSCRGTSSVVVTPNSGYAPTILKNGNGAGRRVSFIAQSSGLHLISATNVMGAGNYSFRAVDTTLFNPRWNTSSGNDTQWGVFNLSDMAVTGTLTIFDTNGNLVAAVNISIPPNGRSTRFTGAADLNFPRNLVGAAIFSHNGPPYAIIGDAFLVSSTGTPPVAVKFEQMVAR